MTREEQLACLKDRPCDVCKMRTDKGCSSWECVFEQTPDEEKEKKMAEFPTYEEMAKNLAEKALDEFLYDDKSIREWMQIIVSEDCISRKEVCDYIAEFVNHEYATDRERELVKHIIGGIQHLPSVRPKTELETWEGVNAQITAPKGTFEKIWNGAEEDNDEV